MQGCCGRDDPKAWGWPRLCHCGPCLLTPPGESPQCPCHLELAPATTRGPAQLNHGNVEGGSVCSPSYRKSWGDRGTESSLLGPRSQVLHPFWYFLKSERAACGDQHGPPPPPPSPPPGEALASKLPFLFYLMRDPLWSQCSWTRPSSEDPKSKFLRQEQLL